MSAFQGYTKKEPATLELIRCKRQPGKLRMSRQGCARRYLLERQRSGRRPHNAFCRGQQKSLEACRTCLEGRKYSKEFAKEIGEFIPSKSSRHDFRSHKGPRVPGDRKKTF